jgi:thiol-disulfide isomerase/thioredoxin
MKKKILIVILIALLVVPVFVGCGSPSSNSNGNNNGNGSTNGGNPERQVAPDFSWQTQDGKVMHLSDLKGKVVLLDFWATWCGPCRMTIPHVESIHEKFKDKGLVVIGVNLDNPSKREAVSKFIKEHGITYTVVGDNGTVANEYGVSGIPRFFFIDKHGRIAKTVVGYDPNMEETFTKEVTKLLAEN